MNFSTHGIMMFYRIAVVLIIFISGQVFADYSKKDNRIIELKFANWEIMYNCDAKGYEQFHYVTVPDSGTLKRFKPFHQEMALPPECRQYKTTTYKREKSAADHYDRGHGIHQNLWDANINTMKESNSFANIVPQHKELNRRGLWRHTEKLTECFRDIGSVEVWGGVVWGNDTSNDYFKESHGVITPDYLFKVISFPGDLGTYAWLMPNDASPTTKNMNDYLISTYDLAQILSSTNGINSEIMFSARSADKKTKTPNLPIGCDIS
jgi:endonuclease G, mitochondrial